MTQMGHGPRVDVYQLLSGYVEYLKDNVTTVPLTIKHYLSTVRNYLESFDITILPHKFKRKVRTPRVVRTEKEALAKEDIRTILEAARSIRQKTYLLFLSSTGCRAQESLSIREMDINWKKDPVTIFIRGEHTKTSVSRNIMITSEMAAAIKAMLQYKYRTRHVHHYDKNGRSINEIRTPKPNQELLIFSSNSYQNPTIEGLYNECITQFEELLSRLGGKFAERENGEKTHRKITLHSLRRHVYSVVSDLGYNQFADKYMLGHSYDVSTYYRKPEKERIEIFRKIEPYLTFLNQTDLETRHKDTESRLEMMERENRELQNKQKLSTEKYSKIFERIEMLEKKLQKKAK